MGYGLLAETSVFSFLTAEMFKEVVTPIGEILPLVAPAVLLLIGIYKGWNFAKSAIKRA